MLIWPWKKTQEEKETRPEREASKQNLLWCPEAIIPDLKMKTRGKYPQKYPEGAVVHYTASPEDPTGILNWAREMGYCYFVIDRVGRIYQSFPLDEWGYHAGESSYLGRTGVSKYFVGIEIVSAGRLQPVPSKETGVETKYAAWFHYVGNTTVLKQNAKLYSRDQVRVCETTMNIRAGTYHKYTPQQEESLLGLCLWLKHNNPDVFSFANVVGHDEVAPGRKQDPGGSLSTTMNVFRQKLESAYSGYLIS
ncbi:MAG: N-acetylmuramoyl-L-alanine amidase [Magnetococcus sp. YQC-3]